MRLAKPQILALSLRNPTTALQIKMAREFTARVQVPDLTFTSRTSLPTFCVIIMSFGSHTLASHVVREFYFLVYFTVR